MKYKKRKEKIINIIYSASNTLKFPLFNLDSKRKRVNTPGSNKPPMILVQSNFSFPENDRIKFISSEQTKKGKAVRSASRTPPEIDHISGNASSVSSFISSHKELSDLLGAQSKSSKGYKASSNWRHAVATRENVGSNVDNIIAKYSGEPIKSTVSEKRRSRDENQKIREKLYRDASPNKSKEKEIKLNKIK